MAVVGAGVAGLAAAEELAPRREVVVLDRLPVPGGVLPYDHPGVTRLAARCTAAGVRWLLGTTAVRWEQGRLLAVGKLSELKRTGLDEIVVRIKGDPTAFVTALA